MIYSLPYILLVTFYGFLVFYSESEGGKERKRELIAISILVYVVFFGFRGFIGTDWTNYYIYFNKCSWSNLTLDLLSMTKEWNYEPGFTLLNLICKAVYDDYQLLVFAVTCINAILIYRFLNRYSYNFSLGMMLFICMGGFVMSTNLLRNSISILLFANALEYIEQRRPIHYFLLCTLALMFHLSSFLFFPLYFFFHKKMNKWIYLTFFFIGIIIFISHTHLVTFILSPVIGLFDEKLLFLIESYTEHYDTAKTLSIGFLERLFTGFLIFCYYDKLCDFRKENTMFINAFIFYFFCFFYLSEFEELSLRLSTLFTFCYWILWADLLKCFSIDNNRRLFVTYLSVYCILKIYGQTNLIELDYDNVLTGAKSYNERIYIYEHNKQED